MISRTGMWRCRVPQGHDESQPPNFFVPGFFTEDVMKTRMMLLAAVAFCLTVAPAFGQGEGNGLANLDSAVNAGAADSLDKTVAPGDNLDLTISYMGTGNPALAFTLLDCTDPQPAADFGVELGILGVAPGGASGIILDPFASVIPISMTGSITVSLVVPGIFQTNYTDFTIQGFVFDPASGAPQSWAVTNTIRHTTVDSASVFQDTCAQANCLPGLSDADLGIPFQVDTSLFNNDYSTTGTVGFGQQTSFTVNLDASGGTAPDALVKFTATAGGFYTFDLCNSGYDSRLWLMDTNCAAPTGIVWNDDSGLCGGLQSALENVFLNAGDVVMVVVEGFGSSSGMAELVISREAFLVNGVSPTTGPIAGGTLVTITGDGLSGINSVTFDGVPGTGLTVIDPMTVQVTTPPGAMAGNVDVVVSDGVDSVTLPGAFQYFAQFVNTSYTLSDDGNVMHALTVPITYGGTTYNDVFINANGQITFTASTGDFSDSMPEFFNGWSASGTPGTPGVAILYTDLNRTGSGSTYDVVEDTLNGTVEIQYNNQQYWDSQSPAGNAIATFSTNHVDLDWTGIIADTDAANTYVIGVTDG
ncbi:MAG TPA: hypothetical protein ENK43_16700, partial [Planctomycetes bacterium]|nr:hypothetical protein [Planctomycetota bacterium]